jgi:hypothetical protein
MFTLKSELLQFIRGCSKLAELVDDEDEKLLLSRGIVPRKILLTANGGVYPRTLIRDCGKKLIETPSYVAASPNDRTRPIATMYNIEKPRVGRTQRNSTSMRMTGRDRLALWYAAANPDYSGSRGEGYGLWLILKFWRQRRIQRAFKKFIERPTWKLGEDAQ